MPESSGSANAKIPASNAPKPATSAIWDVFISYASADTTTAHAIVATLESRNQVLDLPSGRDARRALCRRDRSGDQRS